MQTKLAWTKYACCVSCLENDSGNSEKGPLECARFDRNSTPDDSTDPQEGFSQTRGSARETQISPVGFCAVAQHHRMSGPIVEVDQLFPRILFGIFAPLRTVHAL